MPLIAVALGGLGRVPLGQPGFMVRPGREGVAQRLCLSIMALLEGKPLLRPLARHETPHHVERDARQALAVEFGVPRLVPVGQRSALCVLALPQLTPATGLFLTMAVSSGDVVIPVGPQFLPHRLGGACRHSQRLIARPKLPQALAELRQTADLGRAELHRHLADKQQRTRPLAFQSHAALGQAVMHIGPACRLLEDGGRLFEHDALRRLLARPVFHFQRSRRRLRCSHLGRLGQLAVLHHDVPTLRLSPPALAVLTEGHHLVQEFPAPAVVDLHHLVRPRAHRVERNMDVDVVGVRVNGRHHLVPCAPILLFHDVEQFLDLLRGRHLAFPEGKDVVLDRLN